MDTEAMLAATGSRWCRVSPDTDWIKARTTPGFGEVREPETGTLPEHLVGGLVDCLAGEWAESRCLFAFWEGLGWLGESGAAMAAWTPPSLRRTIHSRTDPTAPASA